MTVSDKSRSILVPHNHLAHAVPAAVRNPDDELLPSQRAFTVALFLLGLIIYFIVNFHRVALPGQIFSPLQRELGASASAIAGLGTSFMYIYAVSQLLVGVLVDRYGGMRVLGFGAIVLTIGSLLFATATTIWMLFASRALVGLGCGCAYLSLVKECARLYPRRFTMMLGFVVFFGYLGGIAGTYPFVMCVKAFGWRIAMLAVTALSAAIIGAMALIWSRTHRPPVRHELKISAAPYRCGMTNINLLKGLSFAISFSVYYVLLTVLGSKIMEDVGGLSASSASLCCSLLVFFSAFCNQIVGFLGTRGQKRRKIFLQFQTATVPIGCAVAFCGILFLRHSPVLGALLVGTFFCIMLASGFTPITNAILMEVMPPEFAGAAVGLGNFAAYFFVAIFSNLAGAILDMFHSSATLAADGRLLYPDAAYLTFFAVFMVIGIGAFIITKHLPETYGHNIYTGKPRTLRLLGLKLSGFHS